MPLLPPVTRATSLKVMPPAPADAAPEGKIDPVPAHAVAVCRSRIRELRYFRAGGIAGASLSRRSTRTDRPRPEGNQLTARFPGRLADRQRHNLPQIRDIAG